MKKAYLPASVTLEAALVTPIYMYVLFMIIFMLQVTGANSKVMHASYKTAQKLSIYEYISKEIRGSLDVDSVDAASQRNQIEKRILKDTNIEKGEVDDIIAKGITSIIAKRMITNELGKDFGEQNCIIAGNLGILVYVSEGDGEDNITLNVDYMIKSPVDIFGMFVFHNHQSCTVRAWTGNEGIQNVDYEKTSTDNYDKSDVVYITEGGEVYHRDKSCSYLVASVREVSADEISTLRNASGAKYYPCEECLNNGETRVYITDYGNRYHFSDTCRYIKKSIREISIDAVNNRRPCSKCGEENN